MLDFSAGFAHERIVATDKGMIGQLPDNGNYALLLALWKLEKKLGGFVRKHRPIS
jgi:hypothetical protein